MCTTPPGRVPHGCRWRLQITRPRLATPPCMGFRRSRRLQCSPRPRSDGRGPALRRADLSRLALLRLHCSLRCRKRSSRASNGARDSRSAQSVPCRCRPARANPREGAIRRRFQHGHLYESLAEQPAAATRSVRFVFPELTFTRRLRNPNGISTTPPNRTACAATSYAGAARVIRVRTHTGGNNGRMQPRAQAVLE